MAETAAIKYEKGLTWRVALALVFAIVVIQPTLIYSYLTTGFIMSSTVWIVIFLWAELGFFFRSPLRQQEVFLISSFEGVAFTGALAGMLAYGGVVAGPAGMLFGGGGSAPFTFLALIQNLRFAGDPVTQNMGWGGLPNWFAPRGLVGETAVKTFFRPEFMLPMSVALLSMVLGTAMSLSLGYFNYLFYVREEKLDFPAQTAIAEGYMAAVSEEAARRRILKVSAFIGVVVSIFSIGLLSFLGGEMGAFGVPFPVVDFSILMERIGLNGASIGLGLSLIAMASGFILPFKVVLCMVASSLALYLVGNHLLVRFGLWTTGLGRWAPGSDYYYMFYWSRIRFWTSVVIGLSIAAAFVPLVRHPKSMIGKFKSLFGASSGSSKEGRRALVLSLVAFLVASSASVALFHLLVPTFPVWVVIAMTIGWSFFATFVSTNVGGVTSGALTFPYFKESIVMASGYEGVGAWFAPMQIESLGGASIAANFKQSLMTRTRISEYVKLYILVVVITLISSAIYTSLFLYSAPIPSATYPATVTAWPLQTLTRLNTLNWIKTGEMFKPNFIMGSFIAGTVIYLLTDALGASFVLPALLGGVVWSVQDVLAILAGSVLGKYIFNRFLGDRWVRYRGTIFTGLTVGLAFVMVLRSIMILISRAKWVLPY